MNLYRREQIINDYKNDYNSEYGRSSCTTGNFFIQKANSFKSSIWIENSDRRANAKSLLGVLSLGISKGDTITLLADGEDEQSAVDGLVNLVLTGFNE